MAKPIKDTHTNVWIDQDNGKILGRPDMIPDGYFYDDGHVTWVYEAVSDAWSLAYRRQRILSMGPYTPIREMQRNVEAPACDCGGHKSRTTHSTWCSTRSK